MSAVPITFDLVTPERLLMSEPVTMVEIPGVNGDMGILARHAPLISALRAGVITVYKLAGIKDHIFVTGGFAEVNGEKVTVLAEEALPLAILDTAEIEERVNAARKALEKAENEHEKKRANLRLEHAETLLKAKQNC